MTAQRLPIAAMVLLVSVGAVGHAYAVFRGADISRGSGQLWYFCFSYCVAWWVDIDRRARGISTPFEYSAFMFFAWPLLVPYYLFKCSRWKGLALGLGLILLSYVPNVVALTVYLAWDQ
jgi:hypothetical protein